ncbi:HNH endonuclease [Deinococcus petrolearius]|uniref:HNH endonuclease n=1 Tax=Deinococcus petrolearius TaxID=1751295 RepID=A0ABW1DFI0_9DEIO
MSRYCRPCRRLRAQKYEERRKRNGGHHTQKEWLACLAAFTACPGCDRRWEDIPPRPDRRYRYVWTKDHIRPLSLGGTNEINNIQPLCYRCQFSKGARNEVTV